MYVLMISLFRFSLLIFVVLQLGGCITAAKTTMIVKNHVWADSHSKEVTQGFEEQIGTYENWLLPENVQGAFGDVGKWELIHVCDAYYDQRQFHKAQSCAEFFMENHLPLMKKSGIDKNVIDEKEGYLLKILANINLDFGRFEKAYQYSNRAIKQFTGKNGDPNESYIRVHVINDLFASAVISALKTGRKQQAHKLARVMPDITFKNAFGGRAALAYEEKKVMAAQLRTFMALGDYQSAEKTLDHSLAGGYDWFMRSFFAVISGGLTELGGAGQEITDPFELDVLYMKGKLCLAKNDLICAKKYFDAMAKGSGSSWSDILNNKSDSILANRRGLLYLSLHAKGKIAEQERKIDEAIEFYKSAIDIVESQRATINTEASKIGFVGDKQVAYHDLINLLIERKLFDKALEYVERGKSRALVDLLATKQKFGNKKDQKNSMLVKLDDAEKKSFATHVLSGTNQRSVQRALIRKRYKDIQQSQPALASLVTVSAPSISALQQRLSNDETLVEYYGSDTQLYVFVMSRSGVGAVKLKVNNIQQNIIDFRAALMRPGTSEYKKYGQQLYLALIAPVVKQINTRNVTFVPHGALHYLPFSALLSLKAHLIEYYNIRILPSASVLQFLNKQQKTKGTMLALGNPDLNDRNLDLPGAQQEVMAIAKRQPGAQILLRKKATETAVKRHAGAYRYLHFASHGIFDADKPLQSGLLLAKDVANDGNLTVGELYDMNLNADLVTLSACETGLGKIANGDDVVGFNRGFLYAGAKSIISSLWKVDDIATNKLMQSFYTHLKRVDKRTALRAAQLAVKKQYPHPYYWAAFQLAGAVE